MTTLTGRDVVRAIERLLEKQAEDAQETKQVATIRLVSDFVLKNGIPVQSGSVATISRILRKKSDEGVRQIRSLSDTLLNKDEEDVRSDLSDLRDKLMPIEARVHQVKTRSAFVATALRPFSEKYANRWFAERTDIDANNLQRRVQELELRHIGSVAELAPWAREVAELFENLVIYKGSDAEDFYTRPAGTVNQRSSRTYLQSWLSFTEKFKDEIWDLAGGGELSEKYDFKLSRSDAFTYEKVSSQDMKFLSMSHELSLATPKRDTTTSLNPTRPRTQSMQSPSVRKKDFEWIQIFIESKSDASAQATRRWENQADFKVSLQKWLDTFPIIWGSAADEFMAKVSVKTAYGESDLTLPALTVGAGAERLLQAVEMQSE